MKKYRNRSTWKFVIASVVPLLLAFYYFSIHIWEEFTIDEISIDEITSTKVVRTPSGLTTHKNGNKTREYKLIMKDVEINKEDNSLFFTISGNKKDRVILNRIFVRANKIEPLHKYTFPGDDQFHGEESSLGGTIYFRVDLTPNKKIYELYNISNNKEIFYYDQYVKTDGVSIFFSSNPGYSYSIQTGFEWFNPGNKNKIKKYISNERRIIFPIITPFKELSKFAIGEVYLYAKDIKTIVATRKYIDQSKLISILEVPKHDTKLSNWGSKSNIYVTTSVLFDEPFLILNDNKMLIKRNTIDKDWEIFSEHNPFQFGNIHFNRVDLVVNQDTIWEYKTKFLSSFEMSQRRTGVNN